MTDRPYHLMTVQERADSMIGRSVRISRGTIARGTVGIVSSARVQGAKIFVTVAGAEVAAKMCDLV